MNAILSLLIALSFVYDTPLQAVFEKFDEFNDTQIMNTCLSSTNPLTTVVEFDVNSARESVCVKFEHDKWQPFKCDVMCREAQLMLDYE